MEHVILDTRVCFFSDDEEHVLNDRLNDPTSVFCSSEPAPDRTAAGKSVFQEMPRQNPSVSSSSK